MFAKKQPLETQHLETQPLTKDRIKWRRLATAILTLGVVCAPLLAEEPETGWKNSAQLSFVAADGNAEATTLGFAATFERLWEDRKWKTDISGLQADSTTTTRSAVGTEDNFRILETSTSDRVAEKYELDTRFDHDITEATFWFAGAGWEQNELAGIDLRLSAIAGVGKTFRDTETFRSSADVGLTYTHEEAVIDGIDDADFLGLSLGWELTRQLTETTDYGFDLEINENLDDTDDLRANMSHHLKVAMSELLALKVTLALAYDNQPALTSVALTRPDGSTGTVLTELDELDSLLTVALVFDF